MKMSLKNAIKIAVWIPSLILIFISSIYFYKSLKEYNKAKDAKINIEFSEILENTIIPLGEERGATSIYAVSKGNYPGSKELVYKKRAKFDKSIKELKDFIIKHPEFAEKIKPVSILLSKLDETRKQIDLFKSDYIENQFFNYYTVLERNLLDLLYSTITKLPNQVKDEFMLKANSIKLIAYSGIIRGTGSYYITKDAPMSEKEYKDILLTYYHDINVLPLDIYKNSLNNSFLNNNKISDFSNISNKIKEYIFIIEQANQEYYLTGEFAGYGLDANEFFKVFTNRINEIKKFINYLNENHIKKDIEAIMSDALTQLIIQSLLLLVSILILLLGIKIEKDIEKHIDQISHLLSSLTPITGENVEIDISTTEGMNTAIHIAEQAIEKTQQAIKEAEEATKAKSLFLANMSHEIRTPLNGILGFLELLETTDLDDEQLDYVNTIAQSAKNLLQIVNNILDVSKIESNKVSLELIEFKALDEIEGTLELFATPTSQKNIEYVTNISPNIPSVLKGDILKIKEILTNLMSNAVKFTPNNGTISVQIILKEIQNNRAIIYFEVKDSGIGMSEEQKNKVFEAFSQADESVTRKYGGTGLGLTIVKSYVEMMGGDIKVESELNKGTKFYFTIGFEIVNKEPKLKENSLSNKTFAILHVEKETERKDALYNYLSYFGVNQFGINNRYDLVNISKKETIDGLIILYEESDKNIIEELTDTDIPLIFTASYANKENISKYPYQATIFDPLMPTKTFNVLETLKRTRKEAKKESTEKATDLSSIRALIAEDNPINQKLLKTTLKGMGIESDITNNGLEAFNKYISNPDKYDVIFMDVQMPIMDGPEATQEILEYEKEEGITHTPIIAVTANVLKGDREKFLGVGMDDYIAKPINKDELLRVLEKVLHGDYGNIVKNRKAENKSENNNNNSNDESKVLLAVSNDLAEFIKLIEPNAKQIKDKEELILNAPSNKIIFIEDKGDDDVELLVSALKEANNKVIVIGERAIKDADEVINDVNPDIISKIIGG